MPVSPALDLAWGTALEHLPVTVRMAALDLAIAGPRRDLLAALGRDAGWTDADLSALVDAGLAVETPGGPPGFAHAVVRDVVLGRASAVDLGSDIAGRRTGHRAVPAPARDRRPSGQRRRDCRRAGRRWRWKPRRDARRSWTRSPWPAMLAGRSATVADGPGADRPRAQRSASGDHQRPGLRGDGCAAGPACRRAARGRMRPVGRVAADAAAIRGGSAVGADGPVVHDPTRTRDAAPDTLAGAPVGRGHERVEPG